MAFGILAFLIIAIVAAVVTVVVLIGKKADEVSQEALDGLAGLSYNIE